MTDAQNRDWRNVLQGMIDRFNNLDKAFDDVSKYHCWSVAHSMADDAARLLSALAACDAEAKTK